MIVEADFFSGRVNPSWSLSAEEAAELASRVTTQVPARQASPESVLGYRGFLVFNPEQLYGLPESFRVYKNVITFHGRAAGQYADVKGVESWLIAQARARGLGRVLDQLLKVQAAGDASDNDPTSHKGSGSGPG